MIDCTAAWVTNIWPLVISSADVIASATTSVSCHQPEPMHDRQQVGEQHPERDAGGDLGDAPQPLPVGRAEADHGRDRREERRRVAEQVGGDQPGDTGGGRALQDLPPLGADPSEAGPHRDPAPVPQPVDQLRLGLHVGRCCQTRQPRAPVMAASRRRARRSWWRAATRPPRARRRPRPRRRAGRGSAVQLGSGRGRCMGPPETWGWFGSTLGRRGDGRGARGTGCGQRPGRGRLWRVGGGSARPGSRVGWGCGARHRAEGSPGHPLPTRRSPVPTPIDPTSAAFLLAENRNMPMHVGGLQLFEKPEGAGRSYTREMYESMRDVEEMRPLFLKHPYRSIAHRRPAGLEGGRPVRHRAPPPAQRAAQAGPGARAARPLRPAALRPAWPGSGRCGRPTSSRGCATAGSRMYTKLHHALVDGVSAMRLLQSVLTTDPDKRDMPAPWGAAAGSREHASPRRTTTSPRSR